MAAARRCFLPSTAADILTRARACATSRPSGRSGLHDERELLVGDRTGKLEAGDANAEQPDRSWRRRTAAADRARPAPPGRPSSPASASVRARVWVEKSSSRILIPIVRPRRRWATSPAHSCSTSWCEDRLQPLRDRGCPRRTSARGTRRRPCAPRSPASRPRTGRGAGARRRAEAPKCGASWLVQAPRRAPRASRSRAPAGAPRSSGRFPEPARTARARTARTPARASAPRIRAASRRRRRPWPRACSGRSRSSSRARCHVRSARASRRIAACGAGRPVRSR